MRLTKNTLIEGEIIKEGTEVKIIKEYVSYSNIFRVGRMTSYTSTWGGHTKFNGVITKVDEIDGEIAGNSLFITVGNNRKTTYQFRDTAVESYNRDEKYNEDVFEMANGDIISVSGYSEEDD